MDTTLLNLVKESQQQKDDIKEEHDKIVDFHENHPWLIQDALRELEQEDQEHTQSLPSIEEIFNEGFDDTLLIDSLTKIYRQIADKDGQEIPILFYNIRDGYFEQQKEKGFEIGDRDDKGYLVTGSDLVIETAFIDKQEFLDLYYQTYN